MYQIEAVLFSEGTETARHNHPNRAIAEEVIRWHVIKSERHTAKLIEPGKATELFVFHAGEVLNSVTGVILSNPNAKDDIALDVVFEEGAPTFHPATYSGNSPESSATCQRCSDLEGEVRRLKVLLDGETRNKQGWVLRCSELMRDKQAEMEASGDYEAALEIFNYWKIRCQRKRSQLSVKDFELVVPYIKKHGIELCKTAIEGAAFDCFVTENKNGRKVRHDDFQKIFEDRKHFESFCNKAERYSIKRKPNGTQT